MFAFAKRLGNLPCGINLKRSLSKGVENAVHESSPCGLKSDESDRPLRAYKSAGEKRKIR